MATVEKTKRKKKRTKSVVPAVPVASTSTSTASTYKPPPGFTPHTSTIDLEEHRHFDWEAIQEDDNLELYVVRLPADLRLKHLNDLSITFPHPEGKITAGKKQKQYEISLLSQQDSDSGKGGEEMKAFSVLLPRRDENGDQKLVVSRKPLAGHILISECTTTESGVEPLPLPDSKRYSHPLESLKGRFVPTNYSGSTRETRSTTVMELDQDPLRAAVSLSPPTSIKLKKRKSLGDGEALVEGITKKSKR